MSVLLEKLAAGIGDDLPEMTRREIRVPRIPNKALAVVGMRRSGNVW